MGHKPTKPQRGSFNQQKPTKTSKTSFKLRSFASKNELKRHPKSYKNLPKMLQKNRSSAPKTHQKAPQNGPPNPTTDAAVWSPSRGLSRLTAEMQTLQVLGSIAWKAWKIGGARRGDWQFLLGEESAVFLF